MRLVTSENVPWTAYAIALGSLFTVLSQFVPGMSAVFALIWVGFLVYEGVRRRGDVVFGRTSVAFLGLYAVFGVYCSICFFMTGVAGYITGFFQLLSKALLMYLVGIVAYPSIGPDKRSVRFILRFYCICAFVYAVWAMVNYFPGFSAWMSSMEYLFASKNSLGQICGVGALALFCLSLGEGDRRFGATELIGGVALWAIALLFQCRTAALAVILAVVFLMIIKKKWGVLTTALFLAGLCVFLSPSLQSLLGHAFLLDKASAGADLSSGRLGLWADALATFEGNELLGIGSFYVDNMYINLLVNVGIIGVVGVLGIWFSRLFVNFNRALGRGFKSNRQKWLIDLVAALSVFYIVESLLEGNPPFGPGACSFMFWMLCGFLDASVAMSGEGEVRWTR